MSRKRPAALAAAVVCALALCCCGAVVGLPLSMFGAYRAVAACGGPPPEPGATQAPSGQWTSTQVTHALIIVSTGRTLSVPPRGYVIALAVAMQESTLRNLANSTVPESLDLPHDGVGSDHDSVGLFQQRPSTGWGTIAELMTPAYAAQVFYQALQEVDGWQEMRLTDAAQAVQRSGFPEAYQKWEPAAEQLAAHVLGLPDIDVIGGGAPHAPCGLDEFGPVPVGPGGWVQPVRAPIVSQFGPRAGRLHAGVDLAADRGTPIRAAAAGTVVTAVCDSSTGTCDRDGSPDVRGCGWYVDIRHAGDIVTRYCHMQHRPGVAPGDTVVAGQVIGVVGSSGRSSGPHLHFEVHTDVPAAGRANSSNAVDPEVFMAAQGAPL